MLKKQVLSCIQPSGEMHLGNYLGAIKNWVDLQKTYACTYGIVDYHALTTQPNPHTLRQNSFNMLIELIACGIDPKNLFIQSQVPEHTELGWILNCVTPYGELSRQTQFKDKSQQIDDKSLNNAFISCGLFTYPVLQAADILIYHADLVPVGKDQEQHLELARNVAARFNSIFDCSYFEEPQCLFTEIPKVMSLAEPTKKMSKSLGEKHYIGLFETDDNIRRKIKTAVTDDGKGGENGMSEGVQNMFEIIKALDKQDIHSSLMNDYENGVLKYIALKEGLGQAIIETTTPFREKKKELMGDSVSIIFEIEQSAAQIRERARKTVNEVRQIVGLYQSFGAQVVNRSKVLSN